jgi:acyl-coenzyme A synthetase/AMP-(fatty) acid ligase
MTGLWALVEWRAERSPDAEMLVDERGRRVTFGRFRDWAERVSGALAACGVAEDVPVTWQLPTSAEALVLTAALARLGAVQNPVITSYGAQYLEFVMRQTAARLLIVAGNWDGHDLASPARAIADRTGADLLVIDAALPEAPTAPPAAPPGDAVRWVFYTSGTTAEPRAPSTPTLRCSRPPLRWATGCGAPRTTGSAWCSRWPTSAAAAPGSARACATAAR